MKYIIPYASGQSVYVVRRASACIMMLASAASGQTLDLDVTVDPATRRLGVSGVMRQRLPVGQPLTLVFGRNGMRFDSASASIAADFTYSAQRDTVWINPRDAATDVAITFHAHAYRDLGRSPIVEDGAMISWGAQWYPLVAWPRDSVPSFSFAGMTRITVPARWRTLASGALVDSSVADGRRTETWRAERPMARSFIAAEFVPAWTSVGSARVAVYLLPRHADRMREYAAAIPRMVEQLSRYFGPYPFATFGIAELPRAVAPPGFVGRSEPGYFIAHTDALDGPGVNVPVFAHELTHMWFPNAVDSRPPGDDMVDEGIASYGVPLYYAGIGDTAAARRDLVEGHADFSMRAYFHHVRRAADEPLMTDYSPLIGRAKGPMVYDMLRRRVGDSVFFGVWRDLVARGGSVSLADLRRLYMARAPGDSGLATFFAQWLDRSGAPEVVATWRDASVTLTQRGRPYALDVPVRVRGTRRVVDTTLRVDAATHLFRIPAMGTIRGVEIDPGDRLLLWKERFGPPPSAPASWTWARWERWMAAEVPWLMRSYKVRGATVRLVRAGQVAWSAAFGSEPPVNPTANDVTYTARHPDGGAEIIVVARGGWGGRQLMMHVAQRVAIQARWTTIPR